MDITLSARPRSLVRTRPGGLRIAIYPETAKAGLRSEALRAFFVSLARTQHQVEWVEDKACRPSDLAILYGAPGIGAGRRRQIRQKILEHHNGPVLIVETPLLGRKVPSLERGLLPLPLLGRAPSEGFDRFRIALNGAFHDTGQFCDTPTDLTRWDRLARELGLAVKDYRPDGEHILLVGQVPGDASLRGLDVVHWLESTVIDLRRITDRPIVIRPHPLSDAAALRSLRRRLKADRSVSWDTKPGSSLRATLAKAWASVTYSSGAAIDSLLAGVPVIALNPASMAWPVSDHGVSYVLQPTLYERRPWLDRLAHSQWSIDEIESGEVWARFEEKIGELAARR